MDRLHALTDGVFAIAMTLLVLELRVPDAASSDELVRGLGALAPSLFSFAMSFAVLGVYWIGSVVNLTRVQHVDRALLFVNVLQLFLIALLPFTTAVLGRYPDTAAAVIVYGVHLIGLGLVQYGGWTYARRSAHLFGRAIDDRVAAAATRRILYGPFAFAVAMLVALVSARAAYALYFVVLIWYVVTAVRDRSVIGAARADV